MVEEAKRIVACKSCPWDQFCITPPEYTSEGVAKQIEQMKQDAATKGVDSIFAALMSSLIFSGRDKLCRACPVFIERLRESEVLIKRIREMMQGWSDG